MPKTSSPQHSNPQATVAFFTLPHGLFVAHLAPLVAHQHPNPVSITQAHNSEEGVGFFPSEGVSRNTLVNPTDCIVIRSKGNGAQLVATEFYPADRSGSQIIIKSLDADRPPLAIPLLAQQHTAQTSQPQQNPASQSTATNTRIKKPAPTLEPLPLEEGGISVALIGHIQNVGDVQVKDNWLGDPKSNNRLEGFAVKAKDLPEGTKLVYACTFANEKLQPQMTGDSQFIGTRQKAQPIKSVVFTLDGEQAEQFELSGEAAFTGGERVAITAGQAITSANGKGHLVALHLKITARPEEEDGLWTEEEIRELFSL
ncbi:hypothetical protein [Flavobacterium sp.]|jgi:hypothetical protein|uniref:hypothetical protein n=1 Tax=Flavobacterium sp. TaxID=239 RepID=UPI0037C057C8